MKKLLFIFLIFTMFLLTSCSSNQSSTKDSSSPNNSSESFGQNNTVTDSSSSSNTSSPTNDKPKTEPLNFYSILGVSNKLTSSEKASMDKWRSEIVNISKQNPSTVIINGDTQDKTVCLTFDDGPDNYTTPRVLDILKKNNVNASFFFIGNFASKYPDVVKRTYNEGNLVLGHSLKHSNLSKESYADINKDITATNDILYNIIGKRPLLLRPPYGAVNSNLINYAKDNNYKIIIWSIDTLDWSQKQSSNIVKNAVDNVRPGEIILMHSNEDRNATLEALPTMISKLKEKGYKFITLSDMLNTSAYQK